MHQGGLRFDGLYQRLIELNWPLMKLPPYDMRSYSTISPRIKSVVYGSLLEPRESGLPSSEGEEAY